MNLVVFDCDGTLADSQYAIFRAMAETFAALGLLPPARERVREIVGLSLAEVMTQLLPNADGALIDRLAGRYREVAAALRRRPEHGEPLFPGAKEAIARLASRGDLVLGLATGKSRAGVAQLFAREGLQSYFSTVQTSDAHPSKPHPAMLEAAMAEAGASPEATIMVGDSTYDMEMARLAGVAAIGVAWGYHPPSALVAAGASVIVGEFEGLEPALDRLLSGLKKAS